MTPEEKVRQMEIIKPLLCDHITKWVSHNISTVRRTKVFPTMYTFDRNIPGMGIWTLVATAESKANIKKNTITVSAYQKFYVPHAKNKDNIGTGFFLFKGSDDGLVLCQEYSPHCINRFRQRLIEPKGIAQPSFSQIVKRIMIEHFYGVDTTVKGFKVVRDENNMVQIVKSDENDRYKGYDNLITYTKNGLFLGIAAANRRYFCYTTFVSNEELYDDQLQMQKDMIKERTNNDFANRNNPFAKNYNQTRWILKDGTPLSEWK